LSIEENATVKGRVELAAPGQKAPAAQAPAAKVEQGNLVLEPKA